MEKLKRQLKIRFSVLPQPRNLVHSPYYRLLLSGLSLVLLLSLAISTALSQTPNAYWYPVRTFEIDELGISHPAGLAFSPQHNAFFVLQTDGAISLLTPFEDLLASQPPSTPLPAPLNSAFY